MALKKNENQVTIDTVYGPFTLNRPSLFTQLEKHKIAAKSVGGVTNLDAMGELFALWMAEVTAYAMTNEQLKSGKEERPKGWPEDFSWEIAYDPEFLPALVKKFNEWQASFRKPETTDANKEGRTGGSEEPGVLAEAKTGVVTD